MAETYSSMVRPPEWTASQSISMMAPPAAICRICSRVAPWLKTWVTRIRGTPRRCASGISRSTSPGPECPIASVRSCSARSAKTSSTAGSGSPSSRMDTYGAPPPAAAT